MVPGVMLFTGIFNLVVLIFCWRDGDIALWLKGLLTGLFLGSFLLVLWTPAAVVVSQCILIAVTGVITFGWSFLTRDPRGRD